MAGYGMNTQNKKTTNMLDRLLATLALLLVVGILAWAAMDLNMKAMELHRENNSLKLYIAKIDRAMPWIKTLNESLTDLEKCELDLKVERSNAKCR